MAEPEAEPLSIEDPNTLAEAEEGSVVPGEEVYHAPPVNTPGGTHISIPSLRNPQSVADLGRDVTALHHVFGVDMTRKGNMSLIEDDTIIYATSTAVVFQNVHTGAKEYLMGIDDSGVGCVAVHPSGSYFAVGGRGFQPNLYVYTYPEKKIVKVMSGGAERGYACLNFSGDGETLASVSTSPDFMLTIWNWEEERMGLHSKAFGQDVYNVRFSEDDPGRLTTSGTGHIRFWKMASTFTGLKLQGSIGKFGKIDLSDIDNFVELPDGKVVSSTESGSLLLWEGHFIKCRLTRSGGLSCHEGPVTYLYLDRVEKCVISAGEDGYVRFWDFTIIDNAEVDSDHSMDFDLQPVAELFLGEKVGVRSMVDSGSNAARRLLVILDTLGRMQSLTFSLHEKSQEVVLHFSDTVKSLKSYHVERLASLTEDTEFVVDDNEKFFIDKHVFEKFHSARITGMDTCPMDTFAATCAEDGTVRCINYVTREVIATRTFSCAATCLKWLPLSIDSTGKMVAVGFADGVVRVLCLGEDETVPKRRKVDGGAKEAVLTYKRKMVFKPHNAPVTDLSFSSDATMLATSGSDGIIFFFGVDAIVQENPDPWVPVRFVTVSGDTAANVANSATPISAKQLAWGNSDLDIMAACTDGVLREFALTDLRRLIGEVVAGEEVVTYEEVFPLREVVTRVPVHHQAAAATAPSTTGTTAASSASVSKVPSTTELATAAATGGDATPTGGGDVAAGAGGKTPGGTLEGAATPGAGGGSGDSVAGDAAETITASKVPAKIGAVIYSIYRDVQGGILCAANWSHKDYLFECDPATQELPLRELPMGLYTADGKDLLKAPSTNCFRYSQSRKYLVTGHGDGVVTIRPSKFLEVVGRAAVHNNAGTAGGVSCAALSFDDHYLLSVGADCTLVVRRVRLDLIRERAQPLYKDLDAGVYGLMQVKPEPKSGPEPEPDYMKFVSTIIESKETELLFENLPTRDELDGVEPKSLLGHVAATEGEEGDLAPGTYSIQDNRLKAEEDAKKVAADELKGRVKASIIALRKDYDNILKENASIPEVARLDANEILVDKEYLDMLAEEGKDMIAEVHRECAHEAERAEAILGKIDSRMRNRLLMEETSLAAFDPPPSAGQRAVRAEVCSFRCQGLDPYIEEVLQEVHELVKATELRKAQIRTNETAQRKANEAMDQLMHRLHHKEGEAVDPEEAEAAAARAQLEMKEGGPTKTKTGDSGADLRAVDSSVAVRRQRRMERKEGLKQHMTEKPNEDEDDIRDLNAIKLAEKTIGDYKLKCADDYKVPEEQRSNATKKVRQMTMLEESMLSMRLQFNERFLALRNLKRQIIFAIRRDNRRIREIDEALQQPEKSTSLWEPRFDPDEFPDDADEVTEQELAKYENDRAAGKAWDAVKPPTHLVVTGTKTVIRKNQKKGTYEAVLKPRTNKNPSSIESIVGSTRSGGGGEAAAGTAGEPTVTTASTAANADESEESKLENILSDSDLIDFTPPRTDPPRYYETNPSIVQKQVPDSRNQQNTTTTNRMQHLEQKVPSLVRIRKALTRRMQLDEKNDAQQTAVAASKLQLEFERSMILQKMQENIAAFGEAVDDLRTDRHAVTADLQMAQLKLLVLYQEYCLLQTFESRDAALQEKQVRCKGEETEIKALASDNKSKLDSKDEELLHWDEKLTQITAEFKAMLPDTHPYCEILTRIFRKKIKRNKGNNDGDEDEDYDEDDDDDDDEDDEEEVEDICPPGCDQLLFERILELREKKLDTEEVSADIQKGIEDLRRNLSRLKSREQQIIKEAQQTEVEVQQFQLQKQAALNQISVVVPIRVSQVYMFESSGTLTGPSDANALRMASMTAGASGNLAASTGALLGESKKASTSAVDLAKDVENAELLANIDRLKDLQQRTITSDVDLKSHTLFTHHNLVRLKDRIEELHKEIDDAKEDFRFLHRERGLLTKERENRMKEIEVWSARCKDLQMLKFGREIDLDELEASSDRSKERDAEGMLMDDAEKFRMKSNKVFKESARLEEELAAVTQRNTTLLNEVAQLTEMQSRISKELNAPGQVVTHTSKLDNFKESEEQKRIAAYIKFQATELDSLRAELNMLKRKEAPPTLGIQGPPVPPRAGPDVILPPIAKN